MTSTTHAPATGRTSLLTRVRTFALDAIPAAPERKGPVLAVISLVVTALLVALPVGSVTISSAHGFEPLLVVAGMAAFSMAEARLYRHRKGQQAWQWSTADSVVTMMLFLMHPVAVAVMAIAGVVIGQFGRVAPAKIAFNIGQYGLSVLAAGLTIHLLGNGTAPSVLHVIVGMAAYFTVNHLLVMAALIVASPRIDSRFVVRHWGFGALGWAANVVLGVSAGAAVLSGQLWLTTVLMLSMVAAHYAYHLVLRDIECGQTIKLLYDLAAAPSNGERAVAQSVLNATAAAFDVPLCQLTLIGSEASAITWTATPTDTMMVLDDHAEAFAARVAASAADGQVSHLPLPGYPHTMSVVLPTGQPNRYGVLTVAELDRFRRFTRDDRAVLAALGSQAATLISRSHVAEELDAAMAVLAEDRATTDRAIGVLAEVDTALFGAQMAYAEAAAFQELGDDEPHARAMLTFATDVVDVTRRALITQSGEDVHEALREILERNATPRRQTD